MMLKLTGHWQSGFYAVTIPGIVLGICCFFFKDPPRGAVDNIDSTFKPGWHDYLNLLKIKSYVYNCLGMAAMTFAIGGISFWMPTYLREERGLQPGAANVVFGLIVVVSGLASTLFGGWVADKLRARFPGSYFHVCGVGMVTGFPCFLAMLYTPFPWAWVAIFCACFCLFLNTGPGSAIIANVTHPNVRAIAFALNIFVIHLLGEIVSWPLLGWIKEHYSLHAGFMLVSVMMAAGGVVWWLGAPHLKEDMEAATHHGEATARSAPAPVP
ncbi:MAG: MFS transporter [Tepidisphaeraceae bacterium]